MGSSPIDEEDESRELPEIIIKANALIIEFGTSYAQKETELALDWLIRHRLGKAIAARRT